MANRPAILTISSGASQPSEIAGMHRVLEWVVRIRDSAVNVLLAGDSTDAVEQAARIIHQHSPHASGPFVTLHVAALTEPDVTLIFDLLSAFPALVVGSLFLDETAELSPLAQARLLRLVEERGVRILAGTTRDLEEEIGQGRFRQDLYYRLKVVQIQIPPADPAPARPPLKYIVAALEERLIRETLRETRANQQHAARILGLSRQGLINKMKRYRIAPPG